MMENSPAALGLDPHRWDAALSLARRFCEEDRFPAISLLLGRADRDTGVQHFGRHRLSDSGNTLSDDALFLVASITKPIVAMAMLSLVERGWVTLNDRVVEWIPEFKEQGKKIVTIRHLLTHTSGLPDMLPDNQELRASHATLERFVQRTCESPIDFVPGFGVQYQSMGYAVLGALIHRISGRTCADFLREEVLIPLGMNDTALGLSATGGMPLSADRLAEIRLTEDQIAAPDWNWNSKYWRNFGAPWGGLITTTADLGRYAQMMLNSGRVGTRFLYAPATIAAATTNQLEAFRDVPSGDRRTRGWGLGWRLNWPAQTHTFGDLLSPTAYGHWGATGTMMWIDPARNAFAVILSTEPFDDSGPDLVRLSNALAACLVD